MNWIKDNWINVIKYCFGIYIFFVVPLMVLGLGWAVVSILLVILIYRYKFIDDYGNELLMSILGGLMILVSLYEEIYTDYGDSLGYALRAEPVWWLLIFGVLIIISVALKLKDELFKFDEKKSINSDV